MNHVLAYLEKALSAEYLSAWVLVAVTFGAAYVAIKTLRAIEHEAVHAAKIALAAGANVDALLNSERAWVSVKVAEIPDLLEQLGASRSSLGVIWILPTFQNYGRTPARVKKIRAKVKQLATDNIPKEPNYEGENYSFDGDVLLVPATPVQLFSLGISNTEFGPAIQDIIRGIVALYIYGYVDYVDINNRPFQTRFCFVYRVQAGYSPYSSGFYMAGPPAYNKAS